MNALREKRALLALAQRFGQPPAPGLVEEIQRLEEEERCISLREAEIRQRIAEDLQQIWENAHELVQPLPEPESEPELKQDTPAESQPVHTPIVDSIAHKVARVITESGVVAPEPVLAQPQKDLTQEIKYLREWVSRIAATGPGGGAAQVYNLDMPTKLVTTSSYTVGRKDYYIGVNYAGRSFITLPTQNLNPGRDIIIKDESGRCEAFPITVIGNVDNDPGGFILRINNGGIHLIYRDGWRIV